MKRIILICGVGLLGSCASFAPPGPMYNANSLMPDNNHAMIIVYDTRSSLVDPEYVFVNNAPLPAYLKGGRQFVSYVADPGPLNLALAVHAEKATALSDLNAFTT